MKSDKLVTMLIGPSYLPDLVAQLANFVMVIVMVKCIRTQMQTYKRFDCCWQWQ